LKKKNKEIMLKYNYGLKQDKEEKCESADDAKTCKSINIK